LDEGSTPSSSTDQAENKTPPFFGGVFYLMDSDASSLAEGRQEIKKAMRSMVFYFLFAGLVPKGR